MIAGLVLRGLLRITFYGQSWRGMLLDENCGVSILQSPGK
jgi:hypothetical protein